MGSIKLQILATQTACNISIHFGVGAGFGEVEIIDFEEVELVEDVLPIVFVHYNYKKRVSLLFRGDTK